MRYLSCVSQARFPALSTMDSSGRIAVTPSPLISQKIERLDKYEHISCVFLPRHHNLNQTAITNQEIARTGIFGIYRNQNVRKIQIIQLNPEGLASGFVSQRANRAGDPVLTLRKEANGLRNIIVRLAAGQCLIIGNIGDTVGQCRIVRERCFRINPLVRAILRSHTFCLHSS